MSELTPKLQMHVADRLQHQNTTDGTEAQARSAPRVFRGDNVDETVGSFRNRKNYLDPVMHVFSRLNQAQALLKNPWFTLKINMPQRQVDYVGILSLEPDRKITLQAFPPCVVELVSCSSTKECADCIAPGWVLTPMTVPQEALNDTAVNNRRAGDYILYSGFQTRRGCHGCASTTPSRGV